MKIVDDAAEQDLLEALLEASKPPLPAGCADLDYLLATPFRYDPLRSGSRFRARNDPGVFYGAQDVRTACAELAFWRWKFLRDAPALGSLGPVAHTAFSAALESSAVDLRLPPLNADAALWTHPADYRATQEFAATARQAAIGAIVYRSVRHRAPSWCVAVLTPQAFASRQPDPLQQTWWLAVQADGAVWRRDNESLFFAANDWRG